MTNTQPQVVRDLLASIAKLEGNLKDAMAVAGEHRAEVEPILTKVQSLFAQVEECVAGTNDVVDPHEGQPN